MSHVSLVRLKRQARRSGITQDEIAAAANVGRSLVSHVFAGRAKSSNVVATTRRLVEARRTAGSEATGRQRWSRAPKGRRRSTAALVVRHATGWAGDDLEARLAEVHASRSRARV